jgi:hypothetical protein
MRRRWVRKSAKWTFTIAAVMVVGAAVFSLFRTARFSYASKNSKTTLGVSVGGGVLVVAAMFGNNTMGAPTHEGWRIEGPEKWIWLMYEGAGPTRVWRGGVAWHTISTPISFGVFVVTLLHPFLLTAIPAGLLWWKDLRRLGPGRCPKCGYDRAGLTAGANCPECGTPPATATV